MAMSNSSKSPGRTPPFVLVALVLLVAVLGYNYWTLSSSNKTLRQLNDKLAIESKDSVEKRMSVEKSLESAREELRIVQGNLDNAKKFTEEKDNELGNLRAEQKKSADEVLKSKDSLAKCDEALQTEKSNVEKLTGEKTKLEEDLKAAKEGKKTECGAAECIKPVKDILTVATKAFGTGKVTKALTDANLDANKLMEGIEKVEIAAPAQS